MLITTKCKLKSDLATMDFMTNQIVSASSVVVVRPRAPGAVVSPPGRVIRTSKAVVSVRQPLKKSEVKERSIAELLNSDQAGMTSV